MKMTASFVWRLTLCAAIGLVSAVAQNQDPPPNQPFQAVHLINLRSADAEKAFLAALTDINAAISKAGCAKCRYRLLKVIGTQAGDYSYLWTSNWPGREVYLKVHNSPVYQAAINNHQDMNAVMNAQIYNRYVEVTTGK